MRIVLGQKDKLVRDRIREYMAQYNSDSLKNVNFTSSPDEILKIARRHKKVLIVSSYIFSNGLYGTGLALEVKKLNPSSIFYIYSVEKQSSINTNEAVDGFIPKFFKEECEELAGVFCCEGGYEEIKVRMRLLADKWM